MVLFLFAIMLLNLGTQAVAQESRWLNPKMWIGPVILASILLVELVYVLVRNTPTSFPVTPVTTQLVGASLFGPYLLGVEMASLLLLAGLVGAHHLGQAISKREQEQTGS